MTRLGYVVFALFLFMVVGFFASPEPIDGFPPHGTVMYVHALPDGTALVAWSASPTDIITHVRGDGTMISAQLVGRRLDTFEFSSVGTAPQQCPNRGCGTYRGKTVVLKDDAIEIGGVDLAVPNVARRPPEDLFPPALWPISGELPRFVGIETDERPVVIDLETATIVWRGEAGAAFVARDGLHIYLVDMVTIREFDPLTLSLTTVVSGSVRPEQIGGGFVWTYDQGDHLIDEPVVHAIRTGTRMITAQR